MELRRDDLVPAASDRERSQADRLGNVEREIRRAQAEALGRTGERLQGILDRLAGLDRRLDALSEPGRWIGSPAESDVTRVEIESRNRLRDEAMRIRHHLVIQREALGFARHTPVEQCYPVPARRPIPRPSGNRGREP